eukprot:COSAG01_NODE_13219_length_1617_cov_258.395916_3_plen_41_part_01
MAAGRLTGFRVPACGEGCAAAHTPYSIIFPMRTLTGSAARW